MSFMTENLSGQIPTVISMLIIISIVGSIGNLLVVVVYALKHDKLTANVFILVLAVSDSLCCLTLIPITIIVEYIDWKMRSNFLCKAYYCLNTTFILFSSLLISCIAFDRYFCLCHPFRRILTIERSKKLVAAVVSVSMAMGVSSTFTVHVVLRHNVTGNYTEEVDVWGSPVAALFESDYNRTSLGVYECTETIIADHTLVQEIIYHIVQKCQTACYIFCIISVVVLYIMIYKSVSKYMMFPTIRFDETSTGKCNQECDAFDDKRAIIGQSDSKLVNVGICLHTDNVRLNVVDIPTFEKRKQLRGSRQKSTHPLLTTIEPTNCLVSNTTGMPIDRMENYPVTQAVKRDTSHVSMVEGCGPCDHREEPKEIQQHSNLRSSESEGTLQVNEQYLVPAESTENGRQIRSYDGKSVNDELSREQAGFTSHPRLTIHFTDSETRSKTPAFMDRRSLKSVKSLVDTTNFQNLKTAAMLFVVALCYIVTMLPAMMMIHNLIPLYLPIFYVYYVNNAINPIVYGFMNPNFRRDIRQLFNTRQCIPVIR
ncbi:orexin receptor type 2 [Clonorchis sinensis]|uniref:Orexin receptor type 2 n=1 Tax=Clonorchis sinensis TaxID=79923 RepID=G7YQV5_CLOSI|nr:orexin receptor type 2 [Clonorchis sinensis]